MAAGSRIKQDDSISIFDTKLRHILVRSSPVTTGTQKRDRWSSVRGGGAGSNLGSKAEPEDPQKDRILRRKRREKGRDTKWRQVLPLKLHGPLQLLRIRPRSGSD